MEGTNMRKNLIKSEIKLTIGMLVSNHKEHIRKVMEGMRPLLESVSSELIVVDTKGEETDGSIAVVREYTDRIYPFKWCNDFSAARNVCLEHARGEWFLYQDDDEWFDDVTELVEFFNSGECEKYQSGCYYTRDYDSDGVFSVGIAGRIIRRREDTAFEGRVHEVFNEMYLPSKQFSCFTHHYGYAFKTLEEAQQHQKRNVSILEQELTEKGYSPQRCAQMVQELIYLETSRDKGYEKANQFLDAFWKNGELENPATQWIMVASLKYFLRKGETESARKRYDYIINTYPVSQITQLVLHGIMAEVALAEKNTEEMLNHAVEYIVLWDWKQSHEQETMLQVSFDFSNYLREEYYYHMLHIAGAAANRFQAYAEAKIFWDRMPWKKEGFDGSRYVADVRETLEGLRHKQA